MAIKFDDQALQMVGLGEYPKILERIETLYGDVVQEDEIGLVINCTAALKMSQLFQRGGMAEPVEDFIFIYRQDERPFGLSFERLSTSSYPTASGKLNFIGETSKGESWFAFPEIEIDTPFQGYPGLQSLRCVKVLMSA